jgi:Tol biopolymer transport system component
VRGRAAAHALACAFAFSVFGAGLAPAALDAQGRPGAPGSQDPKEAPKPLPLEAARKSTFTAMEGSWMSLDVSPDGRTIVFDLLGSLYTLPMEGGTAKRLTSGMAFDAQPRFSPDGKKIVFVSDRSGGDNVWTMSLDMIDTTQVTQGNTSLYASPAWSPDGDYIVVSRSGGLGGAAKLQLHHVDGRSPMPVIRAPSNLKTLGAAWSPDGKQIWYAGRQGDWSYNAVFPQYQLFVYDRETGRSTLMSRRYGSAFRPGISPDGRWLVYGTREGPDTGLRVRDLRTGDERWLAYPVQRDDKESRATLDVLPGFGFTPDSRDVVVSYGGKIWRVPLNSGAAREIPFQAEVELAIGPEVKFEYRVDTDSLVTARQIRNTVPSPDGSMVAFTAFGRVWVKTLPDGAPRRISSADIGEYHPAWSPDGRSLAWVTWDDESGGMIMRAPVAGRGGPVALTRSPALYYNVAWSPDGERVVATRVAARVLQEATGGFWGPVGGEFIWIPARGGEAAVIAPTGPRDVLHFRADEPDRLYAYGWGEGLVSFRWDGSDLRQHLRVTGPPPPGLGIPVHDDHHDVLPRRVFPVLESPLAPREGSGPGHGEGEPAEAAGPRQAGLVLMSPTGGYALAQVGSDIYSIMIPEVGGPTPSIDVANLQGGPVPVRKLTDIGGEFPAWSADGNTIHWSVGNAFVSYDLERVRFVEDSAKADARAKAEEALRVREMLEELKKVRTEVDSLKEAETGVPAHLQARLNTLRADSVRVGADTLLATADSISRAVERIRARADSVAQGLEVGEDKDDGKYEPEERRITITMARDIPRGTMVLRGGRVITMREHEIIEDADVLIQDNRIVAAGPRGEVDVPPHAHVVDVTGRTLIPGFVDTHYHAQWLTPQIHPRQAWQYLTNLAYGVTTTRDPQTATTDILGYSDQVEIGGMVGPRIYSTGPGLFATENIRDLDHARNVMKRYAEYYDTKTLKMYMSGNRQQRQWIIQAARELEIMPSTEGGLDFKLNLTHAMDGYPGIEHALPITPLYQDVVELFKASQTTNSPTLLVSYGGPFAENYFYATENILRDPKLRRFMPEDQIDARVRRRGPGAGGSPGQAGWFVEEEHVFPRHARFVRQLVENGARAAVGSHGQLQGLGYHWELWAMGSGGLSNHDALRTATIFGAEAIGMAGDLGTIEAGKLADILVLDGDPLESLRNTNTLRYIMKNGRLYRADTLDEVWPHQRPLPTQPWQNTGPAVRAGVR